MANVNKILIKTNILNKHEVVEVFTVKRLASWLFSQYRAKPS